jgi:hypothetical protein
MAKEKNMKATLEFILPEEENEFKLATKGSDFFCALWDISQEVRNHDKYGASAKDCITRIREIVYNAGLDEIE